MKGYTALVLAALICVWVAVGDYRYVWADDSAREATERREQDRLAESRRQMVLIVATPAAWDHGCVCIATVESADARNGTVAEGFITLVIKNDFSDKAAPTQLTLPAALIQSMTQMGPRLQSVTTGDELVLWVDRQVDRQRVRPSAIFALPVDKQEVSRWISSLTLIQNFRRADEKTKTDLAKSLLQAAEALPVHYFCEGALGARHKVPPELRALILKARDNVELHPVTRLWASKTLHRYDRNYKAERRQAVWVRNWLSEPRSMSYRDCEKFLDALGMSADLTKFTAEDFPLMVKLLRSPKTDEVLSHSILNWIGRVAYNREVSIDIQDRIIHFMIAEALSEKRTERAIRYLWAARSAMGTLSSNVLTYRRGGPEGAVKTLAKLGDYVNLLEHGLEAPRDEKMQRELQSLIRLVRRTVSLLEESGKPAPTTNPGG